jgi:hypothetical protein
MPPPNPSGLCMCGCGQVTSVANKNDIARGDIRGQSVKFIRGHFGGGRYTHGMSSSPEYSAYQAAHFRCTSPNSPGWEDYGGRGIKFLFASFEQFLTEVGKKPTAEHSIDRYPNNDGNYEPGNVRWATHVQQQRNKRKRKKATSKFRGVSWNESNKGFAAFLTTAAGKRVYLGTYKKEKEAACARDAAVIKEFGICENLNFPLKAK